MTSSILSEPPVLTFDVVKPGNIGLVLTVDDRSAINLGAMRPGLRKTQNTENFSVIK